MPFIELENKDLPGIFGLLYYRPEMTQPLVSFTQTLLRGASPISIAEREIIASHVSALNDCFFCYACHGATAAAILDTEIDLIDEIKDQFPTYEISRKFKSLLDVAGLIQQGGSPIDNEAIEVAKRHGATDIEIHDTVLLSAAFCMFNRYVEGLGAPYSRIKEDYIGMGKKLASDGYSIQRNGQASHSNENAPY